MTPKHYILNADHSVTPVALQAWALWFETADCRVALTPCNDGSEVSTVFLGLDHAHFGGPPLLFETMIHVGEGGSEGGEWGAFQRRYTTWDEAVAGHAATVTEYQQALAHLKRLHSIAQPSAGPP